MNSISDLLPQSKPLAVDVRGGAHVDLVAPDTVTFVLYAPFKSYVSLVGDFNSWNTRANRMVTDGAGTWWTTITHPGATQYGFYVAVDEQTHAWVGDPYATEVAWTTKGAWGVLAARSAPFEWTDEQWHTPALRDLIIYELCVRDFAGRWVANQPRYGHLRELTTLLDYLVETGVNAVELMPIQAFPGTSSWGYNPVFYFAIANTYGTPQDLKVFVNACHARGLAVILDVAFNHAWGDHPYYRFYPPMYGPKGERLDDWNPFFHHTPPAVNMWGGVDWDHFAPETTRYFQDVVCYWLKEFHVDGFRFDWVGGVDYDSRNPARPGCDPYHGISAICWAARQAKPDCILVGEYWPVEGAHPDKTSAQLVAATEMNACWNGRFHHVLEDVLNQRWAWEKNDIWRALGGFRADGFTTATQIVNYTCSHDEVRPEHEIKFYSWVNIERPTSISVEELALAKARLGLIALFAVPGIPLLYAGQEFGEDAPRTIDFQPLHWEKLRQPIHAQYYELVTRLIQARRQHPALRSDQIEFYADNFVEQHVVRFTRWPDAANNNLRDFAAVALNFGHRAHSVTLALPWAGEWHELVKNQVKRVHTQQFVTQLEPWSAVCLTPKW